MSDTSWEVMSTTEPEERNDAARAGWEPYAVDKGVHWLRRRGKPSAPKVTGKHDIYGEDYDVSKGAWPAGARVELEYADQVPGAVVESAKNIFTRSDDPLAICIGELRQAQEKIRMQRIQIEGLAQALGHKNDIVHARDEALHKKRVELRTLNECRQFERDSEKLLVHALELVAESGPADTHIAAFAKHQLENHRKRQGPRPEHAQ